MRFDLHAPCPHCPFRQDCLPGWLGAARAQEIAASVVERDLTFACHETVQHDDEGEPLETPTEQHCAGALLFHAAHGWPNWRLRLAAGWGLYTPARLRTTIPIFGSVQAMVAHHDRTSHPTRKEPPHE